MSIKSQAATKFLKKLSGKVAVFFDNDTDGICGAAIFAALLKQKNINLILKTGELEKEVFDGFAKIDANHYIFVDFAVDQYPNFLDGFKGRSVLLVDHHPIITDLNKLGFLHVNPRFKNPKIYRCSAHTAFDLCKAAGLKNFEWLSTLGQIGDRESSGTDEEKEAAGMIEAVCATKKDSDLVKLANFLSNCKNMDEFLYMEKYRKLKEQLEKELEKQLALFEVSTYGEIIFFEVKSRFSITSILASRLLDLYPNKTIITYSKKRDGWGASGRSKKFDMGTAFRKASEGIGKGGGHTVASGARVSDIEQFKSRLLSIFR